MPTPGEYKTIQARILAYAEAIDWKVMSRKCSNGSRAQESDRPMVTTADVIR